MCVLAPRLSCCARIKLALVLFLQSAGLSICSYLAIWYELVLRGMAKTFAALVYACTALPLIDAWGYHCAIAVMVAINAHIDFATYGIAAGCSNSKVCGIEHALRKHTAPVSTTHDLASDRAHSFDR